MSSTSNAQNLLVNVFRPTYTYQAGVGYTPSLVVSNVDKLVADTVISSNLVINDPASNVYIGCNAGNAPSNVRASSNNVAIGYNAGNGFSNTSNTVALGYNALGGSLSNVSNTVALGANTIGGGVNNILIGHDTGTVGSNNILIGPNQSPGNISNQLRIGLGSKTAIGADLSTAYVGINTTTPIAPLDVSGQAYFRNKVGIQVEAPSKSLEVNGETYSSIGFLAGRGNLGNPAFAFYADGSTGLYSPGNGYGSLVANGLPYITFGASTIDFHNRTFVNADISGGGGGGIVGNTITLSNGLFRDLSGTSVLTDISGGNIAYAGSITNTNSNTRNVIGGVVMSNGDVSANTYNGPGGTANAPHYTFSDDRTTGLFFPGTNIIGWTAGGVERMRISNSSIGIGTTAPGSALDVSGVMRVVGTAGNITFSNGTINAGVGINISGTPIVQSNGAFSNPTTTSNSMGGVVLSNNAISNSGTHTSGNFIGTGTTSNWIGGVTLNNFDLSMGGIGRILGQSNVSNVIGGVVLANGIISNSDTAGTNWIGGVRLGPSNTYGVITEDAIFSKIGNIQLSNGELTVPSNAFLSNVIASGYIRNQYPNPTTFDISSGIWTSGNFVTSTATSNRIGGVTLNASNISTSGTITTGTGSNNVGGVLLSNNNISNSGTITTGTLNATNFSTTTFGTTNVTASGYIRDAVNATKFDISSGIWTNGNFVQSMSNDTLMLAGGNGTNTMAYSTNGTTWSNIASPVFTLTGTGFGWNGSIWVGTGSGTNTLAYSYDGTTWNIGLTPSPFSTVAYSPTWNGQLWVAGGNGTNTLAYSTDGINWTGLGTSMFVTTGFAIAWNGSMFLAAGQGGNTLAYSYDGINWNVVPDSPFTTHGYAIAWNGRMWVAGGQGTNSLAYSYDGINWTGLGTSIFNTNVRGIAWNGSMWVAAGQGTSHTLAYSYDGINWTGLGITYFSTAGRAVAWNGSVWVAGGSGTNTLIYSTDGIAWTGLGSSLFTSFGASVVSRKYILPLISSSQRISLSNGRVTFDGSLVQQNSGANNNIGGTVWRNKQVGIGTTGPTTALDICASDVAVTVRNPSGSATIRLVGGAVTDTSGMQIYNSATDQGLFNNNKASFTIWTNNQRRMTILSNGNVGVGTSAPAYALDVTAASNTPSINMSTWPRFPVTNTLIAVASNTLLGGVNGGCYNFSNPIQSIDSNLMAFTPSNGSVGNSFIVKKSGIWNITFLTLFSFTTQYTFIDVSTANVVSNADGQNGAQVVAWSGQVVGSISTLNYTGYLPSNDTYIYKIRGSCNLSNYGTISNRLMITFLGETPNSGAAFPF